MRYVIIAALAFALAGCTIEAPATEDPTTTEQTDTFEVTAANVIDAMGSEWVVEFCDRYFALGDYELALKAFREGYGSPVDGGPGAVAVFDEALARC